MQSQGKKLQLVIDTVSVRLDQLLKHWTRIKYHEANWWSVNRRGPNVNSSAKKEASKRMLIAGNCISDCSLDVAPIACKNR